MVLHLIACYPPMLGDVTTFSHATHWSILWSDPCSHPGQHKAAGLAGGKVVHCRGPHPPPRPGTMSCSVAPASPPTHPASHALWWLLSWWQEAGLHFCHWLACCVWEGGWLPPLGKENCMEPRRAPPPVVHHPTCLAFPHLLPCCSPSPQQGEGMFKMQFQSSCFSINASDGLQFQADES